MTARPAQVLSGRSHDALVTRLPTATWASRPTLHPMLTSDDARASGLARGAVAIARARTRDAASRRGASRESRSHSLLPASLSPPSAAGQQQRFRVQPHRVPPGRRAVSPRTAPTAMRAVLDGHFSAAVGLRHRVAPFRDRPRSRTKMIVVGADYHADDMCRGFSGIRRHFALDIDENAAICGDQRIRHTGRARARLQLVSHAH